MVAREEEQQKIIEEQIQPLMAATHAICCANSISFISSVANSKGDTWNSWHVIGPNGIDSPGEHLLMIGTWSIEGASLPAYLEMVAAKIKESTLEN